MEKNEAQIDELLSRGVGEFIDPDGLFRKKLLTAPESIVIKFGIDPTRPDIHLGHAVVFRKLRQFQNLGCKVIFLVGDFTALIGDPTGKSKVRPEIQFAEVNANVQTYLSQINKILSNEPAVFSWITNSDWFMDITDVMPGPDAKVEINIERDGQKMNVPVDPNSFAGKALLYENTRMQKTHLAKNSIQTVSFTRVMSTLRHITHSRLIERDMFKDRIKSGAELYMHEMLYPVLQGIDSATLANIYGSCDLEVGGTDQTFNMLMGRDVMKMNKQAPQAVLAFKLLEGLDGREKMSKSLDNYVGITDEPSDMYGKIMSLPDSSIGNYFELCTFTPLIEVDAIREGLKNNAMHPKEIKMQLARQIVEIYHGREKAEAAEADFVSKFQKKEIPENIPEITVGARHEIADKFVSEKIVSSKTEFRRFLENNAVTQIPGGNKIKSLEEFENGTYKIGSHTFIKLMIENV